MMEKELDESAVDNLKRRKKLKKKEKIIKGITCIRSFTRQEILAYIKELHKVIKNQQKKLKNYKHKLKFLTSTSKEPKTEEASSLNEKTYKNPEKSPNFIDDIRQAAEAAQNLNGFIFEPTSGLYYDQKTGYYYNAEYGLYYDGNTGCYYKYDQEKNEFIFYSQVQIPMSNNDKDVKQNGSSYYNYDREGYESSGEHQHRNGKKHKKEKKKKNSSKQSTETPVVQEEGEIISDSEGSANESSESNSDNSSSGTKDSNFKPDYQDIAKKYPPCLRIIVQKTSCKDLKEGSLYIITYKGGTLGREGDHDVIIPDVNVSKFHLKFTYDENRSTYQCLDLGSRNGTILNGKRISNAKQESDPVDLMHGSIIIISQTKLLCHVHQGNSTCGHCEPGLLVPTNDDKQPKILTRKEQLKKLQKRYGLENEKYIAPKKIDSEYKDRAAVRRDTIGSTNEHEKTQVSSVNTEISCDNKGFKMLSKLGWNKGESLGKNNNGLKEPVPLVSNEGKTGLGCNEKSVVGAGDHFKFKKSEKWKKAKVRYDNLSSVNIFETNSDSSSNNEI